MQRGTQDMVVFEKVRELFSLVKTGGFITEEGLKLYGELVEMSDQVNKPESHAPEQLIG